MDELHPYIKEIMQNMLLLGFNANQIDRINEITIKITKLETYTSKKAQDDMNMFITLLVIVEHTLNKNKFSLFNQDDNIKEELYSQIKDIAKTKYRYEFEDENLRKFINLIF